MVATAALLARGYWDTAVCARPFCDASNARLDDLRWTRQAPNLTQSRTRGTITTAKAARVGTESTHHSSARTTSNAKIYTRKHNPKLKHTIWNSLPQITDTQPRKETDTSNELIQPMQSWCVDPAISSSPCEEPGLRSNKCQRPRSCLASYSPPEPNCERDRTLR